MSKITNFLLLLALSAICSSALAETITESQAREIANSFMATHNMSSGGLRMAQRGPSFSTPAVPQKAAYYIFNGARDQSGYVIIAGDDRVPAVLGYSDSGSFDIDNVPPALQEWLDGYALQIEAITLGSEPEMRSQPRAPITPMLSVRWGQGMPYNVLLPHINGSTNAHAYVGCVAVAMAQIMAYWQYPARPTTTIPGYTSNSGKTYAVNMPSLSPMNFDWENMHGTYYTIDSTSTACMAVANLMLYSTTAMQSNFGLTSTGAYTRNIPEKLITYFGYKNSAHYLFREYYSTQAWEDTIYAELAAGRPVAYAGNKQSGGHAFVCDGYDGDGRFHINWGWAGKSNGYFLLNLLNPSNEGIGSAAGAYGYVKGQGIGIGIEPANHGSESGTAAFTFDELAINSYNSTRSSASSNFSVTVSGKFVNYTNVTSQFRQGWGLYNADGELVEVLFMRYTTSALSNGEYVSVSARPLNFGAGITSGTYRILPIYSIYPSEDYRPCIGSDVNYIEVKFDGTYSCIIRGYGTAGSTTSYNVNSCTTEGTLNHGKSVTVTLNLTNRGTSTNDLIYMFVGGEFNAMGLANIGAGETGDIVYRFTPTTAGTKTLTFSLNENGTPTLYTQRVTINTMPSATLDVSYRILNITDEDNRVITADRYSIIADVTNTGTTTYDEDFSVRLYRVNNDQTNVGTELHNLTQPLLLAPGQSKSLQFDFDHDLIDGWKYFCYLYYYSNGETVSKSTKWYQLNLINVPDNAHFITATATPTEGGTVNVNVRKAEAGDTVTFTVTPNSGYALSTVSVTTDGGEAIDFTLDDATGIYSFIMPDAAVTVNATFDEIPVYNITATASPAAGGILRLNAISASAGEIVDVTPSPNVGWQYNGLSVTTQGGSNVTVTPNGEGAFSFIMPEEDVTVTVDYARSTGSLFRLVDTRADITEGDTYVLLSRTHGKVMKYWSNGDATFQADNVTGWLDESQNIARVSDEACFFTMTEVSDTTVSSNARTAAYLTTGNAYMRTSNYNVLLQDDIMAESRAWMYIGNASNCLIRFKDSTSGSNGNWIVRYDNENDDFKVMNWNVTGAETSRVWLYKLVEAYPVLTECDPVNGGNITVTSGLVDAMAQAGETVTFTVTAAEGYDFAEVAVITTGGDTIATTIIDENGTRAFTMPDDGVTIKALFAESMTPDPGDVNGDGLINIKDVTDLINYLLNGYSEIVIPANADVDNDGLINIKDVTTLIDRLLSGN